MKKIVFLAISIVLTISMFADNKRAMRVFYNGEIVRSLDATKIDSINLHFTEVEEDNLNGGDESETMEQLYVGVVAFNQRVFLKPITSDVAVVKTFINEQTNDKDQTSIAYAASRGNQLFEANDLPKFDKVYMLNFTDGFDNFSSRLWRDSIGRVVNKDYVYDTARYDLLQHAGLNSYALAFGEEAIKVEEQTKKLVLGTGKYYEAANASQLQPTFNEIAKSMLASAQNAVLQTNAEYYFASAPKKFQLIFTTKEGYTDIVYASMTGTPSAGYKLEIDRVANQYVSFDSPAYGKEDIATHKANIPLNNMKFIKDGEELQFKYQINILTRDGSLYAEDVEDASSSEEINKRIAVVLVLDCSTSMGDAFVPMKDAAVKFIETMQKMEVDTTKIYIPDVDVIWDLNGGTINSSLPSSITSSYYNTPIPIREGCNFVGWYDNPNGIGSKYSRLYRGHKGILYAIWETPPTVSSSKVGTITHSSATVYGNVVSDGGAEITERGVVYSTSPNPTIADRKVQCDSGVGSFECTLTSLSPGTTYYVRSYAVNKIGVAYGEEVQFVTPAIIPSLTICTVSDITASTATIISNVLTTGGAEITEHGFVYSFLPNPTLENSNVYKCSTHYSWFQCVLKCLSPGTTYFVRSYAVNEVGVAYGEEVSFTTLAILPTIGASSVSDITSSSATISASVTADGGAVVSERGLVYGTTSNPTISDVKVSVGNGVGDYEYTLDALSYATVYYVRPYAVNEIGIAYGEEISFTTLAVLPTVSTYPASNITSSSATISASVTADGGAVVSERGLVYGTTSNPTISDVKVSVGNGVGDYEYTLDALSYATVYYVRPYAVNEIGVAYGEEISFTTLAILPTMGTSSVSDITSSSATISSSVTSDGGATVTERGVVYSNSANPTIDNATKVVIGSGSFACSLSSLNYATTYYVRSYAVNEIGVAYGEESSFTTLAVLPTVSTYPASNITSSSATISSNVVSDGGASVIERGVVYSTSSNPTVDDIKIVNGSGVGTFTCSLTSLTYATTYYVRSYAVNEIGIAYGEEVSFTTLAVLPTVSTYPASNITSSSAKISSNVVSDGGTSVTERGVVYSTSSNPTVDDIKIVNGSGVGNFTCVLNSLSPGTTYYVRPYAVNEIGIAYGEEISFTTLAILPTMGTSSVSNITSSSATISSSVVFDGGAVITERGVVYSTSSNPTIDDTKVIKDGSTGWFSCALTSLAYATTYYARSYAVNEVGVAYGEEVSFTTLAILPSVGASSVSHVTSSSATISGSVLSDGGAAVTERGVVYSTSSNPTIDDIKIVNGSGVGNFTCALNSLSPGTTYYARSYAVNEIGVAYGEEISFTTLAILPTMGTSSVSDITSSSATISSSVTSDGGATVTERGVVYSNSANPTIDNATKVVIGSGSFACSLSSLSYATTYYVRSYAVNEIGVAYGEEISFTTLAILPTMGTSSVSDITSSSATISSNVVSDGGATITERGVVYSTSSNPTIDDIKIVNGSGVGNFTCALSSLSPGSTYYVRSYAVNEVGVAYGEEVSFTTLAILPSVGASSVSNITSSSATISGSILSDGGAAVTERGVVYSNSANPTIDNATKVVIGSGSFACSLSSLSYATTYYVRSYAVNEIGVAYGEEISFTTLAILPTMGTSSVSDITSSSATISSNVVSDGGATITERGVVYSTSSNPTIDDIKIVNGSGVGNFTCALSSLSPGSTYYVRSYAVNEVGVAYGEEVSFTTLAILPSVGASSVSNITSSSATISGSVLSDGGAAVTERGVVYSTSQNPTTSNSKIVSGSGLGSFACSLSSLSYATTYYVRSYAVNEIGVAYGEEISFTTLAILPTMGTSSVSDITSSSATISSNVVSDGGTSVTERGVVYSTSSNPTVDDIKIVNGSGVGNFTCVLNSLSPGTTYYVRPYAVNEIGIAYGEEISFTTLAILPTMGTSSVTNITSSSATISGTVLSDGGASVTERGVVYSTSNNPTISNSKVTCGNGIDLFTCNLNSLQPSTTYYARAYAINSVGTAYGEEVSFTTNDGTDNGYEYVDLGLSVKWATCNVGASKPEEYGDYFAWGETQPKSTYDWSTYKWCNGSSRTQTKYCTKSNYGTVDNKTVLEAADDAARANWGGSWRMPTDAELTELREQCTWTWTTQNGVYGYKVTSKKSGYTNKSIFLPAAGYRDDSSLDYAGSRGYYWSSSLDADYPNRARRVNFGSDYVNRTDSGRYLGQSVRPVCQ